MCLFSVSIYYESIITQEIGNFKKFRHGCAASSIVLTEPLPSAEHVLRTLTSRKTYSQPYVFATMNSIDVF